MKINPQFLRIPKKSKVCRGQIVQVDTEIVFQAKAVRKMVRLSFDGIKNEDYVSNRKVNLAKLEQHISELLYEDRDKCLNPGTFTGFTEHVVFMGKVKARPYEVHHADNSEGK